MDDLSGYHQFKGEGGEYGSFEVFEVFPDERNTLDTGWYWWACFPGCIPDGDQSGPFKTAKEAYDDAQST